MYIIPILCRYLIHVFRFIMKISYSKTSLLKPKAHHQRDVDHSKSSLMHSLGLGRYSEDTRSFTPGPRNKNYSGMLSHFMYEMCLVTNGDLNPAILTSRSKDHILGILEEHVAVDGVAKAIGKQPIMLLFGLIGALSHLNKDDDSKPGDKLFFPIGHYTLAKTFK